MSNFEITVGDTVVRLASAESAGLIVAAFAGASVFERHWDGTMKAKPTMPSFAFVDAMAAHPAVVTAREEAKANEKRWLDTVSERDNLKRRLAELEAQA